MLPRGARATRGGRWLHVEAVLSRADPFVKVYLLQDGRKISKKKTAVKRDDNNPVFNEAMIFSVPAIVLQVRPSLGVLLHGAPNPCARGGEGIVGGVGCLYGSAGSVWMGWGYRGAGIG